MLTNDQIQRAGIQATELFGSGFHCAEAVAWAALGAMGDATEEAAAHSTAFGGGFGRTFKEACGALSGALVVIGHQHGRRQPGGDWDLSATLGAEMRQRFIDAFGTTVCADLRSRFGEAEQQNKCRQLVGQVTESVLSVLAESPDPCTALGCERTGAEAHCTCGSH